jgi:hypothetical protein
MSIPASCYVRMSLRLTSWSCEICDSHGGGDDDVIFLGFGTM